MPSSEVKIFYFFVCLFLASQIVSLIVQAGPLLDIVTETVLHFDYRQVPPSLSPLNCT